MIDKKKQTTEVAGKDLPVGETKNEQANQPGKEGETDATDAAEKSDYLKQNNVQLKNDLYEDQMD